MKSLGDNIDHKSWMRKLGLKLDSMSQSLSKSGQITWSFSVFVAMTIKEW